MLQKSAQSDSRVEQGLGSDSESDPPQYSGATRSGTAAQIESGTERTLKRNAARAAKRLLIRTGGYAATSPIEAAADPQPSLDPGDAEGLDLTVDQKPAVAP